MVRSELGALACFKEAAVVKALPKTRSGKTLRSTMRKIVDGKDYVVPSTIDDPAVLETIAESAEASVTGKNNLVEPPSGRSRRLPLITRPPAFYGANPRQEPGDCKSRDS